MYNIEKGSYQESVMYLQDIGLMINEMKQKGEPVTYEMCQELLQYALNVVGKAATTMDELVELFDQVPSR